MKTSHLVPNIPRSLFAHFPAVALSIFFLISCKCRATLMMAEEADLWVQQKAARHHFIATVL